MKNVIAFSIAALFSVSAFSHHLAPEEMTDFIEDALTEVGSPHLLSTEDDPSLTDTDLVVDAVDISFVDVVDTTEDIVGLLVTANNVEDFVVTIELDETTDNYSLYVAVDYSGI